MPVSVAPERSAFEEDSIVDSQTKLSPTNKLSENKDEQNFVPEVSAPDAILSTERSSIQIDDSNEDQRVYQQA